MSKVKVQDIDYYGGWEGVASGLVKTFRDYHMPIRVIPKITGDDPINNGDARRISALYSTQRLGHITASFSESYVVEKDDEDYRTSAMDFSLEKLNWLATLLGRNDGFNAQDLEAVFEGNDLLVHKKGT